MIVCLIILLLSIVASGLTYYFTNLYQNLIFIVWLPILFVIGYFIVFLILWLLIIIINSLLFYSKKSPQKKIRPHVIFLLKQTSWILKIFFFVKFKITNKSQLNDLKNKNCVIVINHTSNFDQILLWAAFPKLRMVTLSKPELEDMPIVGRFMHQAGVVSINRDSPLMAMRGISKSISLLKNDPKACMCVYPEGTRHIDGNIQSFHSTPFLIVKKLECPLVILSMQNSNQIKYRKFRKITKVYIDVIKVLSKEEIKNMSPEEMSSISYNLISNNLENNKNRNY